MQWPVCWNHHGAFTAERLHSSDSPKRRRSPGFGHGDGDGGKVQEAGGRIHWQFWLYSMNWKLPLVNIQKMSQHVSLCCCAYFLIHSRVIQILPFPASLSSISNHLGIPCLTAHIVLEAGMVRKCSPMDCWLASDFPDHLSVFSFLLLVAGNIAKPSSSYLSKGFTGFAIMFYFCTIPVQTRPRV